MLTGLPLDFIPEEWFWAETCVLHSCRSTSFSCQLHFSKNVFKYLSLYSYIFMFFYTLITLLKETQVLFGGHKWNGAFNQFPFLPSFWLIVYFSPIRKFSVATYDICISGLSPIKLLLVAVGLSTQLEVSKPLNFQWISFFITKLFPPRFWRDLNPDSYRFLLIRQPAPDLRSFCC